MWIVRDLLTAMNRTLVDSSLWKKYLRSGMDLNPGHSSIVEIMSHCDLQTVRAALMQWIHRLRRRRPLRSGMQRDLELLAEKAEGISFLHSVHYSSRQYSPLSLCKTSQSFTKIRELLQNSSHFEIVQMVREDIRLCARGGQKTHSWPCSTKKWNSVQDRENLPAKLADAG
jgi:lipopolysaccharide biosynthesis regulator YciM